jgi:hypothetical protein
MAKINSLDELKDYCLRKLGYPVIEINVSEDQIYDRINDAIDFFNEYHFNSTARFFHKHQITATDIENEYITIPPEITHIKRILPLQSEGTTAQDALFDPVYQMRMSDFMSFNHMGSSMQYWNQWGSHIKMMQMQFGGAQQEIDFNRYNHQLKLRIDWQVDVTEGDWVIIDAERLLLDPDSDYTEPSDVYNDMFLKELSTALIKLQWGQNLSKYEGIQLPGGTVMNGEKIFNEAQEEVLRLKEEARSNWEAPLSLFVG